MVTFAHTQTLHIISKNPKQERHSYVSEIFSPMKNFLPLFCFLFIFNFSFAHETIRGKVIDSQTDKPVIGAYVLVKNSSLGTTSDADGNFSIKVDSAEVTLVVSFIGFASREYVITNSNDEITIEIRAIELNLEQITVNGNDAYNLKTLSKVDVNLRPVNSSQDLLGIVPGLFIAQHAGGGKAEQIFLRGFDIDHGTDIQINVDGMPVNMVSHAHGQGYADLHFMIPELVRNIDFGKGPYDAAHGDFTTAGYVDFNTYNRLDKSEIRLEGGRYNTFRLLGLMDILGKTKAAQDHSAYTAFDYNITDGPFESEQNFSRLNFFTKYNGMLGKNNFTVLGSYFISKWDASGQVPSRAVESGMINRFGAIDDTEGGATDRTNVLMKISSPAGEAIVENQIYFTKYDFELYSNFTFFLEDSINGDQIRQKESRNIFGYNGKYKLENDFGKAKLNTTVGTGLRYDISDDNELSRTKNRQETIEPLALGDVDETNLNLFVNEEIIIGKFLINPAIRLDYFKFEYFNRLNPEYERLSADKFFISPKLNILFNANRFVQLYLKTGRGFHSNDARVVVSETGREILPAAYGADLGTLFKPHKRLLFNIAAWYLYLEQEFVYVGDGGIVEPSGKTRRVGFDVSVRYQILDWLYADMDLNYAHGKALNEPQGEDYIPLAPTLTSIGGLSVKHKSGINGSLRYRYMKDRPANEVNSITAVGYILCDLLLNYTRPKYELSISIENLFNSQWNQAQFDTESRLQGEEEAVSELHFTPGTPLFVKGSLSYFF